MRLRVFSGAESWPLQVPVHENVCVVPLIEFAIKFDITVSPEFGVKGVYEPPEGVYPKIGRAHV